MQIHLPSDVLIISDFDYKGEKDDNQRDLEDWLGQLTLSLEDYFKKVYADFRYGTSMHRVYSTIPLVTDMSEGEIVFYDNGTARRMYTKLNGVLRYTTLT